MLSSRALNRGMYVLYTVFVIEELPLGLSCPSRRDPTDCHRAREYVCVDGKVTSVSNAVYTDTV